MDTRWLIVLLMALLLPLAACSGDDDDDTAGDDDDTTAGDDDDTTAGDDDDTTAGDDDDSGAGDDDDTTAGDDDDDTLPAVAELESTWPADGATVLCAEANIVAAFTDAVTSATLDLEDGGGIAVPGDLTLSDGDTVLTFDPHDALTVATAYTATLEWDGGNSFELNFRTSPDGPLLTDPETAVEGVDYLLDLGNATITQPAAIGVLLASYLEDVELIVQVTDLDDGAGTLEALGGTLDQGVQDLCVPTMGLTDSQIGAWCNPFLEVGPTTLAVPVEGYNVDILQVRINGTVVQEGGRIVSGRIEGSMDTRGLDSLVGGGTGATCSLLASLGVNCEPCPDGSGTYCLTTIMEDIIAQPTQVTGLNPETGDVYSTLTAVSTSQVATWTAGGYCP